MCILSLPSPPSLHELLSHVVTGSWLLVLWQDLQCGMLIALSYTCKSMKQGHRDLQSLAALRCTALHSDTKPSLCITCVLCRICQARSLPELEAHHPQPQPASPEMMCRVYDRVSISLHGSSAQTNFAAEDYSGEMQQQFSGMGREELQRALGVKPMDKSSRYVSVLASNSSRTSCLAVQSLLHLPKFFLCASFIFHV